MAVNTKNNDVNPLDWKVPIVNPDGTPTNEFMRKWAQQAAANAAVPDFANAAAASALLDLIGAAKGDVLYRTATGWTVLAPGADGRYLTVTTSTPAWTALPTISSLLDGLGAAQGDVLYRSASAWTVLPPGSAGQVLTYNATTHAPEWDAASSGLIGAGAPTSLEAAGTLYSQNDATAVWSSQPIDLTVAIVQHKSFVQGFGIPGSVTITSAPTPGNLLIAFMAWDSGNTAAPTFSASWTLLLNIPGNGGSSAGFLLYRYVQGGDTSALPAFCTAGVGFSAIAVYEISGVTGTIATDVQTKEGVWTALVTSLTLGNETVTSNNAIVLAFGAQDNGSVNPTLSAGFTSDESQNNNANYGSIAAGHQAIASSGTVVGATVSFTSTGNSVAAQLILTGGNRLPNWGLVGPGVSSALPSGDIIVGSAGGVATARAMSGDATISNTGAVTVSKSGGVAFGSAAFVATSTFDASGAAAAALVTAETYADTGDNTIKALRASSSVFGLAKVDNTSITASSGVISAKPADYFSIDLNNVDQSITGANSVQLVLLSHAAEDSGGWFDSVNHRFTPQRAGIWFVAGAVALLASGPMSDTVQAYVYKNGSLTLAGNYAATTALTGVSGLVFGLVRLNGTTDYLELRGYAPTLATAFRGSTQQTNLQGYWLAP